MKFFVIAEIRSKSYITAVDEESNGGAEHRVLDAGICGRHEYGVDSAFAFDMDELQTDTFSGMARHAEPISLPALMVIIQQNNNRIREQDAAERRKEEIKKELAKLTAELAELEALETVEK